MCLIQKRIPSRQDPSQALGGPALSLDFLQAQTGLLNEQVSLWVGVVPSDSQSGQRRAVHHQRHSLYRFRAGANIRLSERIGLSTRRRPQRIRHLARYEVDPARHRHPIRVRGPGTFPRRLLGAQEICNWLSQTENWPFERALVGNWLAIRSISPLGASSRIC